MADTLADKAPKARSRRAWAALLLDAEGAAAYVGITGEEVRDLHERGVLSGVILGERLLFRRGDLATLGARLRVSTRRKPRRGPSRR